MKEMLVFVCTGQIISARKKKAVIQDVKEILPGILVALTQRTDSNGNSKESLRQYKKQRLYLRDETKFRGFCQ